MNDELSEQEKEITEVLKEAEYVYEEFIDCCFDCMFSAYFVEYGYFVHCSKLSYQVQINGKCKYHEYKYK